MRTARVIAVLACWIALVGPARADHTQAEQPWSVPIVHLPMECGRYAWLPVDARGDTLAWNQLLSLGTCLQDTHIIQITDRDELGSMLETYAASLETPMMIYMAALENGPGPVQLRAAYQIAMLHLTLIVRARSSIVTPTGRAATPDALRRDRELHDDLEELLAPSARVAAISFAAILRAVEKDPTLARDSVTKSMVRSARVMLDQMRPPATYEHRDLADTAHQMQPETP